MPFAYRVRQETLKFLLGLSERNDLVRRFYVDLRVHAGYIVAWMGQPTTGCGCYVIWYSCAAAVLHILGKRSAAILSLVELVGWVVGYVCVA